MTKYISRLTLALVSGCIASTSAQAADAGSQLRQFQDETQRRMQEDRSKATSKADLPPSPSKAAAQASSVQVHVVGFKVHGVKQFSESEVTLILRDYVGRKLSTADIHAAANTLMEHYRKAGYMLSKVFVPPQSFSDIVRLDVEEGSLESNGIEVKNTGTRVKDDIVQSILNQHLYSDRPLKRHDLERALLLADDLPGVQVGSVVYPGTEVGTARLRAVMSDEPLVTGNIDVDNFNNRQLGQERLGTTLYFNSPSGVGDQVVTRLVTSGSRSNYGYLNYLRPVGSSGLRLGGSIDYFTYDASTLYNQGDIKGHANDTRIYMAYPLVRSRHANLNLRTDFSHYQIVDRNPNNPSFVAQLANPFAETKRRLNTLHVSLSGDAKPDFMPGSTTLFDISLIGGKLDIAGDSNYKVYDANGAKTAGGFARLSYDVEHLQHLSGTWSAYGKLSGQLASGNLDSSQRFYLGGATSLAGFPTAEASGDQGSEVHLELRRDVTAPWGGNLQLGVFYGRGWLKRAKNPQSVADNHISLQSVGLQLTQTIDKKWVVRGLIGKQIRSDSDIKLSTGANSDGKSSNYRAWFQVIRYFDFGGK
jgi:hemolysin activation/secretion protein